LRLKISLTRHYWGVECKVSHNTEKKDSSKPTPLPQGSEQGEVILLKQRSVHRKDVQQPLQETLQE
jgi:hypothetical protein